MNKNKPIKASVIICAYNEEHTISQSLTSLIEQSFQKDSYEILIIDDESTDKTSEIVKEIIENNSTVNIKYIRRSIKEGKKLRTLDVFAILKRMIIINW